jgi:hypothetical protein
MTVPGRVPMGEIGLVGSFHPPQISCHLAVPLHVHPVRFDYRPVPHDGTQSRLGVPAVCVVTIALAGMVTICFADSMNPMTGMPQTISGYHAHPEATL